MPPQMITAVLGAQTQNGSTSIGLSHTIWQLTYRLYCGFASGEGQE